MGLAHWAKQPSTAASPPSLEVQHEGGTDPWNLSDSRRPGSPGRGSSRFRAVPSRSAVRLKIWRWILRDPWWTGDRRALRKHQSCFASRIPRGGVEDVGDVDDRG